MNEMSEKTAFREPSSASGLHHHPIAQRASRQEKTRTRLRTAPFGAAETNRERFQALSLVRLTDPSQSFAAPNLAERLLDPVTKGNGPADVLGA